MTWGLIFYFVAQLSCRALSPEPGQSEAPSNTEHPSDWAPEGPSSATHAYLWNSDAQVVSTTSLAISTRLSIFDSKAGIALNDNFVKLLSAAPHVSALVMEGSSWDPAPRCTCSLGPSARPESHSERLGPRGIQLQLGFLGGHSGKIPEDKLAHVKVFC